MSRTAVLVWTDSSAFIEAIEAAGLADRVAVDIVARKDKPSAEQLSRTEVLAAMGAPPGLLSSMPKLRWVQRMYAGVERCLAIPALSAWIVAGDPTKSSSGYRVAYFSMSA